MAVGLPLLAGGTARLGGHVQEHMGQSRTQQCWQGEGLQAQTASGPSLLLVAVQPGVCASFLLAVWLLQVSDILCIPKLDANYHLHGAKPLHDMQVSLLRGMVPAPGGLE